MTQVGLFCHADDVAAGVDLLGVQRAGVTRLIVNVLYHDWAVFSPLSRVMPMRRELGGASAVAVGPSHPPVFRPDSRPGLDELVAKAQSAGLALDAWTVSLHRDDLSRRDPDTVNDLVPVDAFGARLHSWICPSSEEALAFLSAHARDIAGAGVFERLVVEGCHYPLLQHGGAHERDLSRVKPETRQLLSLCFCRACMARLANLGSDPQRWCSDVAAAIITGADLAEDVRMHDTLALRRGRVLDLFSAIQSSAPDLEIVCADQPAIAGATFRTGLPSDEPASRKHAIIGFDLQALATAGIRIMCLAYFRTAPDVSAHVRRCLDAGVPADRTTVVFRPAHPDCASSDDLVEKLCTVRDLGVNDLAFYELTQMDADDVQRMMTAVGTVR